MPVTMRYDPRMTKDLERAFAEAKKLPERQQDAIARWLLAELEAERDWDESLSRSSQKLADLGAEAVREHREHLTRELDPDSL